MKKILFISLFALMTGILSAQTVENIQVEQDGEKLNINYRIGGSTSEQIYFVTLTCSIDGKAVFEPKSVIGDVGTNIRGGKSFNTIVWNVFNDVEEVGNVEFFVKVDLTKDESIVENAKEVTIVEESKDELAAVKDVTNEGVPKTKKGKKKFERTFLIAYSASAGLYDDYFSEYVEKIRPVGIKAAYLDNWGWYGALRFGWDYREYYITAYNEEYFGYSAVGGVTKHITGKKEYRLYGYGGIGIDNSDFIVEAGLTLTGVAAEWFVIDIGAAVTPGYVSSLVFGIGYLF